MTRLSIDINTDTGENGIDYINDQVEMLEYVSSCNIATGFHAGDPYVMSILIREAHRRGVAVGAHPSYPDKEGFGRHSIAMSEDQLYANLVYQISAISGMCRSEGVTLRHIKLHGALYHDAHQNEGIAGTVIRFIRSWPTPLILYGQSGSILEKGALQQGINWVPEGFVDRRYDQTGHLVPRSDIRGVIRDRSEAIAQAIHIIRHQKVTSSEGRDIQVTARTLCIHGDHPNALDLARALQQQLKDQGIQVKPPEL